MFTTNKIKYETPSIERLELENASMLCQSGGIGDLNLEEGSWESI